MKLPLSWLKDYVDMALPPKELAHRLTMSGTEVGGIEARGGALSLSKGGAWDNTYVGQIMALRPHPNADRLQLADVSLSAEGGERFTVVAGAFNIKVGDKVPFAKVGATLIDGHSGQPFTLKAARIRGVASEGMACSERELGLSDDHTKIMVLPPEAPLGAPLADYLGDVILDLEITPNRPDCLSVLGVAREVAALTGQKVREPEISYTEGGPSIESQAAVEILDADLCPRYCATLVRGVKVGPSPDWMQERLAAAGMRPINNVVDVTNYVMLEYGQPLHAFDFDKIKQGKVIVRRARLGESLVTLDGVERGLSSEMLLIADPGGPIALAGVMGGRDTEVTEATTNVLLESANFHPTSIRRTSRALRLLSEASSRFDKGLSRELPSIALRRATQLLAQLCGGAPAPGLIDVYPGRVEPALLRLSPQQVRRILGGDITLNQIESALRRLGFELALEDETLLVTAPYWRTDVAIPEDLAEEVARFVGYDAIPTTMPRGELPHPAPDPPRQLRERLRDLLVACGMQEIITYSLVSRRLLEQVARGPLLPEPMRVANPMSLEQEYLRTSLRPGLLTTLARNQRHQEGGLRLFEVGRIYLPREDDLPQEKEMAAGIMAGPRGELSWHGEGGALRQAQDSALDFYDAKGTVEAVLAHLGVAARFTPVADPLLHPGRSAQIRVGEEIIGMVGELLPSVAKEFDLAGPVALFELDLERLLPHTQAPVRYQPVSRFPAVRRDLALVVDEEVPAQAIVDILASASGGLVREVALFDVYQGAPVPAGRKALAFRLTYQAPDRTLTDAEVHREQERLLRRLEQQVGAQQRT